MKQCTHILFNAVKVPPDVKGLLSACEGIARLDSASREGDQTLNENENALNFKEVDRLKLKREVRGERKSFERKLALFQTSRAHNCLIVRTQETP